MKTDDYEKLKTEHSLEPTYHFSSFPKKEVFDKLLSNARHAALTEAAEIVKSKMRGLDANSLEMIALDHAAKAVEAARDKESGV